MKLQLFSDLHLETESFDPRPAPGAELLVLGGDIDATWQALERFAGWPVPVVMVAGNHEFDGRDLVHAWPELRAHCARHGIRLLERESLVLTGADGLRWRFVATVRWSDFDCFGDAGRERAMRAAAYFLKLMAATHDGAELTPERLRAESLACRDWLAAELRRPNPGPASPGGWDRTVVLTHFAQPAQRRPALRPPARHRQLLQRRRRPDPAGRRLAARPPALPARLPRRAPRPRADARAQPGHGPGEEGRGRGLRPAARAGPGRHGLTSGKPGREAGMRHCAHSPIRVPLRSTR